MVCGKISKSVEVHSIIKKDYKIVIARSEATQQSHQLGTGSSIPYFFQFLLTLFLQINRLFISS